MQRHYQENQISVQYTSLSISSFCKEASPDEHYPVLKGKGGEICHVVGPILDAWSSLAPVGVPHKRLIQEVLTHQLELQQILHDHRDEYFLPAPEVIAFRRHINLFSRKYQQLAAEADAQAQLLWNQPTKFHWLWHLGERSQYLNPRRGNTMLDEDYVGRMKTLIQSCSAGTELDQMPVKAIETYGYVFDFVHKFP